MTKIRTQNDALAEAVRRWGKTAAIKIKANKTRVVGRIVLGSFFEVKGTGASWDAAFADAGDR